MMWVMWGCVGLCEAVWGWVVGVGCGGGLWGGLWGWVVGVGCGGGL